MGHRPVQGLLDQEYGRSAMDGNLLGSMSVPAAAQQDCTESPRKSTKEASVGKRFCIPTA